ncbi:hypothetical protein HYV49_06415 [Candidatus Pacearchaeota archaeon]|nr:hypothetical protein [Candidatus Pacearchaeota archaeon]
MKNHSNSLKELYFEDTFQAYGKQLLQRMRETWPNIPMIGVFKLHDYTGNEPMTYCDLYYTIKKGKGAFTQFNPFAEKLAVVNESYDPILPRIVIVPNPQLRGGIEKIVSELNEELGRDFQVTDRKHFIDFP